MKKNINHDAFAEPIYVTRPVLPDINEVTAKLEDICHSQQLTNNGSQHVHLEKGLAAYLRVPYVNLFNKGTTALVSACQELQLSGDVITTPFTFAAMPHALTWNKIRPIFCDIDPETMNI